MPINADKPHLWNMDVAASVDLFNEWFVNFAPQTYRETRTKTTEQVRQSFQNLNELRSITILKGQSRLHKQTRLLLAKLFEESTKPFLQNRA